ncbi:MAG: P22 phage major capsid protein family protein [Xenococcaceae cyanobacterium MO_207.B15]|nr:P22 phage major capsid protein family protein [Xenococcaceae cyanobacterium MO_207.B15]
MPNILDDVMPKILSSALESLRENCVMPRLVNGDYSVNSASKGDSINVPVPTAILARDVTPANIAPDPDDLMINTVPIPLNYWKEASFYLTDRDQGNIMDGVDVMQVREAGKSIANAIDLSLLNLYVKAYWHTGTAGTTPFATDTVAAQNARKLLNAAACPPQDRRMVLDVDADATASGLN